MKKLLIIGLPVLLLLGGGGAAAWVLLGEEDAAEPAVQEEAPAGLIKMDTFIVNLDDPTGDRFVKLALSLTVAPQERAAETAADELTTARMRDRVLTLLSAKSHEELATPLGKESLRREIQDRLAPLLEGDEIRDVLFSEFVVQ